MRYISCLKTPHEYVFNLTTTKLSYLKKDTEEWIDNYLYCVWKNYEVAVKETQTFKASNNVIQIKEKNKQTNKLT